MKRTILTTSITLACFVSLNAQADYPEVIIDSAIVLEYDQNIDMTGTVVVPTAVDIPDVADISVNQFNHDSPITATASVINNTPSGINDETITSIDVTASAIGNNASIDVSSNVDPVIGSIQGNQNSDHIAIGTISGNRIDLGADEIVELNVTAVGNNLSIDAEDASNTGTINLGSIQYNYDSPSIATGSIVGNGFGVNAPGTGPGTTTQPAGFDPKLTVTAIGNNLSTLAPTTGSITQINRNSPVVASGLVSQNVGQVGPISVNVSAVGNNINIKQPK